MAHWIRCLIPTKVFILYSRKCSTSAVRPGHHHLGEGHKDWAPLLTVEVAAAAEGPIPSSGSSRPQLEPYVGRGYNSGACRATCHTHVPDKQNNIHALKICMISQMVKIPWTRIFLTRRNVLNSELWHYEIWKLPICKFPSRAIKIQNMHSTVKYRIFFFNSIFTRNHIVETKYLNFFSRMQLNFMNWEFCILNLLELLIFSSAGCFEIEVE